MKKLKSSIHRKWRNTTMDRVNQRCYIGDIEDFKREEFEDIDWILNLSSWTNKGLAQEYSYVHIPIADGKDNYQDFKTAVDVLYHRLENTEDTILVGCAVGVSRSVAVTATAMSRYKGRPFDKIIRYFEEIRSSSGVNPALKSYGKQYLE